ncbi:extensin-like, homolog of mammalian LYST-INTERACTING PROTEIN5 [Hibiscus trionum]|uniref:Extensin-like, homolog of mammalian LYST-INTERACTING PROTEIN5 n=1 Tax=Hibiscus trionum TaxID=183268 RepID=A0A9W7LGR7_HIBTR|nr:extensin-like, homolog of mammalian LYST-INTERACTING PROTEIN5 [Hibiscus trionum]
MAGENEPAKLLLPYLQRADELQKHEPLVAYYCRLYAMEKGLKIPNSERTKTTNSLLVSLMNQLEKDKKTVKLGPEDNLHLEGFALNVFSKADKQDRAGRADLNTAKTFYAASIFFEIINQFGPLQPDLEQKQKYAVWKAADIRKALKEGRKPVPGPPNGDEDLSVPSSTPHGAYDLGAHDPAVTNPQQSSDPSPQFHDANNQHYTNIPPSSQFHEPDQHYTNIPPSSQFHDKIDGQHSSNISPSLHSFPSAGYPSHDQPYPQEPQRDFHPSENPTYPQSYNYQPYQQDQPPHLPVSSYPSHEAPSYSYPNFQSYPSFSESSLPSAAANYPSFYQGSETPYNPQSAPPTTNYASAPPTTSYPSTAQHSSSGRNGKISEPSPTTSQKYQYDSNYQPPPEKIVEAHKAARFAVGALAFDDVPTAVEHLKKSLELLTNPSASQ